MSLLKLIGEKKDVSLLSKIKVNVDLAGLFQQLVLLKDYAVWKQETSKVFQNNNWLTVQLVKETMDAMVV